MDDHQRSEKNRLTQQLTASENCVATGQLHHYISRNNREYTSTDEGPPDDDDSCIYKENEMKPRVAGKRDRANVSLSVKSGNTPVTALATKAGLRVILYLSVRDLQSLPLNRNSHKRQQFCDAPVTMNNIYFLKDSCFKIPR